MLWVIYATEDGRGPQEIAHTTTQERAEIFAEFARSYGRQDGLEREITVAWVDEPVKKRPPSIWH